MKGRHGKLRLRILISSVLLGLVAASLPLFFELDWEIGPYLVAVVANVLVANLFAWVLLGGAER